MEVKDNRKENQMSEEIMDRLAEYKEEIEKEYPHLDYSERCFKLLEKVGDKQDIECLNLFMRILKKKAKEHGDQKVLKVASHYKNLSAKFISEMDQRIAENEE